MIVSLGIFAVSLFVLAKSADALVEYAARLARRFHVSDLIVGLVITSVGTSLPELASSISAALAGSSGLVVGNVVGSNIANIGLVLGSAAIVRPFATERRMHDRDGFVLLASTVALFALVLDNRLGRVEAAVFLSIYVAYVVFAARSDREELESRFRDFLDFFFDLEAVRPVVRRLRRGGSRKAEGAAPIEPADRRAILLESGAVVLSLAALIVSARFVVQGAIAIAVAFSLPENLIGLSLVAVGTSLPELLVAISAARQGRPELVVGNVVGSNIANVLLILGVGAMLRPLEVPELSVVYTIPIMLFFSLGLLYFVRSGWRVGRGQGLIAVMAYVVFLATAFVEGWG